jgi:hypothetical protein
MLIEVKLNPFMQLISHDYPSKLNKLGLVTSKMALGQVFLRDLRFSPVIIIPPLLYIYSCIIWWMDSGPVSGRISIQA